MPKREIKNKEKVRRDSERLHRVIKELGTSINSFAINYLGLKDSGRIYNIINKQNGLSKKLIDLICEKIPKVNRDFLEWGEGSPFGQDQVNEESLAYNRSSLASENESLRKLVRYYEEKIKKLESQIEELKEGEVKRLQQENYDLMRKMLKLNEELRKK